MSTTHDQLVKQATQFIESHFALTGSIAPMFHAITADGEGLIIATEWRNEADKLAAIDKIRQLFKEHGVTAYAFMSEAWMSSVPMRNGKPAKPIVAPPSQDPGRVEIVSLMVVSRERSSSLMWAIKRDRADAYLIPFDTGGAGQVEGRMAELLPTQKN